jgi:hypothetical protein
MNNQNQNSAIETLNIISLNLEQTTRIGIPSKKAHASDCIQI